MVSSVTPGLCGLLCLCGLWALPPSAHAQDVTVEQLVTLALERSPELRVARADIGGGRRSGRPGEPSTEPHRGDQP